MPKKSLFFNPPFSITPSITRDLMHIEAACQAIEALPLPFATLSHLREQARLVSTHYSTKIEGNRLTQKEVREVIDGDGSLPGRERDAHEVKGYYAALDFLELCVEQQRPISQALIKKLHGLVMGGGKKRVKPTEYRDGQNVIRDGLTGSIVYLPPQAHDVPDLMSELVAWLNVTKDIPSPLCAAIAHYQFATIHPYYDGNGRVSRLLATLVLHSGGYGLKGIYSLDEYYARDIGAYYESISLGPSHNYYEGRAETDITPWIEYFCKGMLEVFEQVRVQAEQLVGRGIKKDNDLFMRGLDARQRRVLDLFRTHEKITSQQVGQLFGLKERASSRLCRTWIDQGFLEAVGAARKGRQYRLSRYYERFVQG